MIKQFLSLVDSGKIKGLNTNEVKLISSVSCIFIAIIILFVSTYAHEDLIMYLIAAIFVIVSRFWLFYILLCAVVLFSVIIIRVPAQATNKIFYLLSIFLVDNIIYIGYSLCTYGVLITVASLTEDYFPSFPDLSLTALIVFLLIMIGVASTFGVYKLNKLFDNYFIKKDTERKYLKMNLIASLLFNPIIILGLFFLIFMVVTELQSVTASN